MNQHGQSTGSEEENSQRASDSDSDGSVSRNENGLDRSKDSKDGSLTQEEEQEVIDEKEEEIIVEYKRRLQEKDNTVFFELFEMMLQKMDSVQRDVKELKEQNSQVSHKV